MKAAENFCNGVGPYHHAVRQLTGHRLDRCTVNPVVGIQPAGWYPNVIAAFSAVSTHTLFVCV
jgi:hypothetical protein